MTERWRDRTVGVQDSSSSASVEGQKFIQVAPIVPIQVKLYVNVATSMKKRLQTEKGPSNQSVDPANQRWLGAESGSPGGSEAAGASSSGPGSKRQTKHATCGSLIK